MSRIDELQKQYPTIPREIIIKWEVINRGVADTDDLDKASEWAPAGGSYQSYDHDVTLKQVLEKRPWRAKGDMLLRPGQVFMNRGMSVVLQRNSKSPYEVRDLNGQLAFYEGDEKVQDIHYFERRKGTKDDLATSRGTRVSSVVTTNRRCFFIFPVRYCEYFATGDECKFCNFNSTQEDSRSVGLGRSVTVNLQDTIEAYQILGSQTRFVEGRFEMGGFTDAEKESKIHLEFVEKIGSALAYKPNLTLHTEATERKAMQRMKDSGLDCITLQMEVWDRDLFGAILPGKAKTRPYEKWLEGFQDAVDIFGVGNVGGKIIAGLTLMPENGHSTWQEARDCHIEGNNWLIKNGVMPTFTNLRLPPGSVYGATPSLREKLPPTEYYLDVALAHDKSMTQYGLYQKLNRLMYCGLDCIPGPYAGEIGILALAGDVGKWMSTSIPDEANWLAKIIAEIEAPAGANH
ncbi:MAG: hypothetical protein Q7O66_01895 [Dehalococcoidia bacterium]|nr:hypothetical protein [Dehalococcoidia bacterium]